MININNREETINNVDLIINAYEKTISKVLNKKLIEDIVVQNKFKFKNIIIVINNVRQRARVENLALQLKKQGIISYYFFVEDYIGKVLKLVGLTKKELYPIQHYTDWALVCAYVSKSKYLLHWDPDVYLKKPIDWISPSIAELEKNKRYFCASPLWEQEERTIRHESYKESANFMYNDDFSDQVFLAKKENFLKKIYKYKHIYSLRFPIAYIGSTFEKRLDSYIKITKKTRIIFKKAIYVHPSSSGTPYPKKSFSQIIKHYLFMVIIVGYYYLFYFYRDKFIHSDKYHE